MKGDVKRKSFPSELDQRNWFGIQPHTLTLR